MHQKLVNVTLVVRDYDEAIQFYTQKLGFNLIEDTVLTDVKRWVRVQPPGGEGCCLLLAKAANEEQENHVGNQTGGRVFLFIQTDDFDRDYDRLVKNGVNIARPPKMESYGKVAVFEDLYGNLIDLIGKVDNV